MASAATGSLAGHGDGGDGADGADGADALSQASAMSSNTRKSHDNLLTPLGVSQSVHTQNSPAILYAHKK